MPQTPWSEEESNSELDPITSLLSEWSDPEAEEEEFKSDFFQGLGGRRQKAAVALMMVSAVTITLHLVSWGFWLVIAAGIILSLQLLRLFVPGPQELPEPLSESQLLNAPSVSLLVAAKNEEAVIANLVHSLLALDYPQAQYEVWVIDDHSTDQTGKILDQLAAVHPQLHVIHRPAGAPGGKSGALNQVLPLTKGQIIGVFDADAQVSPDLLRYVVAMFNNEKLGAVQVRKAIANASANFWTKGQKAEMALDSYFQQQRIACGGMGELRGNGQFVRRDALLACGGWNEETITDDLDLTIRLHLDQWDIGFLPFPAVGEEGVLSAIALWHQRSRWAEGGYQRYLDYWRLLASQRLSITKKLDLVFFFFFQYLLPTALVPDIIMSLWRHRFPLFGSLTTLFFSVSGVGMLIGSTQLQRRQALLKGESASLKFSDFLAIAFESLRGMIYLGHWAIVMPSTTLRMSIRPKRLKWVKTVHQGTEELGLEVRN